MILVLHSHSPTGREQGTQQLLPFLFPFLFSFIIKYFWHTKRQEKKIMKIHKHFLSLRNVLDSWSPCLFSTLSHTKRKKKIMSLYFYYIYMYSQTIQIFKFYISTVLYCCNSLYWTFIKRIYPCQGVNSSLFIFSCCIPLYILTF